MEFTRYVRESHFASKSNGLSVVMAMVILGFILGSLPILAGDGSQVLLAENSSNSIPHQPESSGTSIDEDRAKKRSRNLVDEYRIGVDDVVRVNVWRNPELSVVVPVRPDGRISVPLIGDVDAGGLTPEEVSTSIQEKLSAYIRSPQVAVILEQLNSHEYLSRVRVTGAVRNPMSVPFRQGMTVLDVVLVAGGVNDFASPNNARLYRRFENVTETKKVRLDDILKKGKLETNYKIQPGDVVTVPERIF